MALDLVAELETLLGAFEADHVEYALCGGVAVAIHGHPRATMDIDILLPASEVAHARAIANRVGFDVPARPMTFGAGTAQAREVQRVSKLEDSTGLLLSVDLIVVSPALESAWQTRVRATWRGRELSIVSRDGLVTMKKLAGRPQDLADVAALEAPDETDE